jgi:hypothetical protein
MVGMPILIDAASERAMMGAANTPAAPAAALFSNVRRSKAILCLAIWIPPYSISPAAGQGVRQCTMGRHFAPRLIVVTEVRNFAAFLLPLILEHPSPAVKEHD